MQTKILVTGMESKFLLPGLLNGNDDKSLEMSVVNGVIIITNSYLSVEVVPNELTAWWFSRRFAPKYLEFWHVFYNYYMGITPDESYITEHISNARKSLAKANDQGADKNIYSWLAALGVPPLNPETIMRDIDKGSAIRKKLWLLGGYESVGHVPSILMSDTLERMVGSYPHIRAHLIGQQCILFTWNAMGLTEIRFY